MTVLTTAAEALADDRCWDLHGRAKACLGCRRVVSEALEGAVEGVGGDLRASDGRGRVSGHLGERQDGSGER